LVERPQAIAQPLHFELQRVSYFVDRIAETLGNLGRREALEIRELQGIFGTGWDGAGAEAFGTPLASDGDEPRGLAAARRVEPIRVLPRFSESLLERFLCALWNPDDAQQKRVEDRRIAIVKLPEGGDIAARDLGKQRRRIRQRFGS
jgi:hypothetical protein